MKTATETAKQNKSLSLWIKMAYGSGDMATNFCYSFLSSFVLIYFTDAVGLNAGIIGTIMLASRLLDGVSDVFAGVIIDRTKTRWGKAKPWMMVSILPLALCEVLLFSVPSASQTVQYVYIFVVYTLLNAVFYTANNVAYNTLAMLITPLKTERVQLGVFRFMFTVVATLVVSGGTVKIVEAFGGGLIGWRSTAILFASLFVIFQIVCVLPLRELSSTELGGSPKEEKVSLIQSAQYLLRNRFFVIQVFTGILYMALTAITGTVGVYYMTYIMGDASLLGIFTLFMIVPMMIGLVLTPALVKRFAIWRTVVTALTLATIVCVPYMIFGLKGMFVPMLVCRGFLWLFMGPQIGSTAAFTAEICGYTMRREGVRIEGTINSCSSMGQKVGMGIGTAFAGILLTASSYDGNLAAQPDSAVMMIKFLFAASPLIIAGLCTALMYFMNVEKANAKLDAETTGGAQNGV
jgi:GPH family glycoside/pentoside/hexuronide:cation symporter